MKLLQLNAWNSTLVSMELPKLADEVRADVVCLQEPHTRNKTVAGFDSRHTTITGSQKAKAAIVVINKTYTVTKISHLCTQHVATAEIITGGIGWIVASIYAQYSHDINPYLDYIRQIVHYANNRRLIIATDINARATVWHSDKTDERGQLVLNVLDELNLFVVNGPGQPPTWRGHAGESSRIDITIANANALPLVTGWRVMDGATSSDHNPIIMNINNAQHQTQTEDTHQRLLFHKADWTRLRQIIDESHLYLTDGSIDYKAHVLTEVIQRAQKIAIPSADIRHRQKIPWSSNLTRLRKETRDKRKWFQRAVTDRDRQIRLAQYRAAKNQYYQEIHRTRQEHWNNHIQQQIQTDIWGEPFKIQTERMKTPLVLSTLRRADGTMTQGWRSSAEYLLNKLLPDDDPLSDEPEQTRLREQMNVVYEHGTVTQPFAQEEVALAISRLKNKKAPGPDGIHSETLKQAAPQIVPYLTDILNEALRLGRVPLIWKTANTVIIKKSEDKDPSDPKTYRPICLINTLAKVQERLLCDRLQSYRELLGLCPHQYGFRKGKSIDDAINNVLTTVGNIHTKYVVAVLIDISGAFDNLWWPAMFMRLREMEVPKALYNSLLDYCRSRVVEWRAGSQKVVKRITKGCPQGSICGPVFWDITFEPLIQKLEEDVNADGVTAYADDLLVLVSADSRAYLEQKTTQLLTEIDNWCKRNKLQLATHKTVYIMLKGTLQRNPTIKLNGASIHRQLVTRYLGVHLDERLTFNDHIRMTVDRATKIMHKLARLNTLQFRLPLTTMRTYHCALFESVVTFAASSWAHRVKVVTNRNRVRGGQRSVLIRLSGAFNTSSVDSLCVILGIFPIDITIRYRAAGYWLKTGRIDKVTEITGQHITRMRQLRNWRVETWQRDWDTTDKGRRAYHFFPDIRERLKLTHIQPSQGMVHFLTGHGPYPTHLNRVGLSQTAYCTCGELGSPEHLLFHCQLQTPHMMTLTPRDTEDLRQTLRDRDKWDVINKIADDVSRTLHAQYKQTRPYRGTHQNTQDTRSTQPWDESTTDTSSDTSTDTDHESSPPNSLAQNS